MNDLSEKKDVLSTAKQELNQIKENVNQKVYLKRGNVLFRSSKEEALEYLAKRENLTKKRKVLLCIKSMICDHTGLCSERYWCGHPSVEVVDGQIYFYTPEESLRRLKLLQDHTFFLRISNADLKLSKTSKYDDMTVDDTSGKTTWLPEEHETHIVVLLVSNVPYHMSPAELCEFLVEQQGCTSWSAKETGVELVKTLYSPSTPSYFCLLFCYVETAYSLFHALFNRPYNPLESDKCCLHIVENLTAELSSNDIPLNMHSISKKKTHKTSPGYHRIHSTSLDDNTNNALKHFQASNCGSTRSLTLPNKTYTNNEFPECALLLNGSLHTDKATDIPTLYSQKSQEFVSDTLVKHYGASKNIQSVCNEPPSHNQHLPFLENCKTMSYDYSLTKENDAIFDEFKESQCDLIYLRKPLVRSKSQPLFMNSSASDYEMKSSSTDDFQETLTCIAKPKYKFSILESDIEQLQSDNNSETTKKVITETSTYNCVSPFFLVNRYESTAYCGVCLEKIFLSSVVSAINIPDSNINSVKVYKSITSQVQTSRVKNVLVNVLCGHTFHGECLLNWYDATCPYCRYQQYPCKPSSCDICGQNRDIKMCLICGFLGCDSINPFDRGFLPKMNRFLEDHHGALFREATTFHAYQHFVDFHHVYAIEIETQRVWDFSRKRYVHRLLQSRTDGKLVEFSPSTLNIQAETKTLSSFSLSSSHSHRKRQSCKLFQDVELTDANHVICALSEDFNTRLSQKLDEQQNYFSELLQDLTKTFDDIDKDIDTRQKTLREEIRSVEQELHHFEEIMKLEEDKENDLFLEKTRLMAEKKNLSSLNNKLTKKFQKLQKSHSYTLENQIKKQSENHQRLQELYLEIQSLEFHIKAQEELDIKMSSRLLADCYLQLPQSCHSFIPVETLKWAECTGSNPGFSEENTIDSLDDWDTVGFASLGIHENDDANSVNIVLRNLIDFYHYDVLHHMKYLRISIEKLVQNSIREISHIASNDCMDALLQENEVLVKEKNKVQEVIKGLTSEINSLQQDKLADQHQIEKLQWTIRTLTQKVQEIQAQKNNDNHTTCNSYIDNLIQKKNSEQIQSLVRNIELANIKIYRLKRLSEKCFALRFKKQSKGLANLQDYYRLYQRKKFERDAPYLCQSNSIPFSIRKGFSLSEYRRKNSVVKESNVPTVLDDEELLAVRHNLNRMKEEFKLLTEKFDQVKTENTSLKNKMHDQDYLKGVLEGKSSFIAELRKTVVHQEELIAYQKTALENYHKNYGYLNHSESLRKKKTEKLKRNQTFAFEQHTFEDEDDKVSLPTFSNLQNLWKAEEEKTKLLEQIETLKKSHKNELSKLRECYLKRVSQSQQQMGDVVAQLKQKLEAFNEKNKTNSHHLSPSQKATLNETNENNKTNKEDLKITSPDLLLKIPSSTASIFVPVTAFRRNHDSITFHVTFPAQNIYVCPKNKTIGIISDVSETSREINSCMLNLEKLP